MGAPVGGGPQNPFDKQFRVERIEEDKLTKDDKEKKPPEESSTEKLSIGAFLLNMFHKAVDFFIESRETSKTIETEARNNLHSLKEAFETLKKEDRSQDVQFLNNLSKIWQHVLEDSLHFKKDIIALKFRDLIQRIQHFPQNQAHTLGYYLTEYAGQKWVPFPYMELIQMIHTEHEKNPTVSALTSWTIRIDELVRLLKVE